MAQVEITKSSGVLKHISSWTEERAEIYEKNELRVIVQIAVSFFSLCVAGGSFYKYKKTISYNYKRKYLYCSISLISFVSTIAFAIVASIRYYTLIKWDREANKFVDQYCKSAEVVSLSNHYELIFSELHKKEKLDEKMLLAVEWDIKNKTKVGPFFRYWNLISNKCYTDYRQRPNWEEDGRV